MSEPSPAGPAPARLSAGLEAPALVDPRTLGSLAAADLAAAMRPLWEDAGPLAQRLVGVATATWPEHIDAGEAAIETMTDEEKADLLKAHPRIGATPAALAGRSTLSHREQGGDVGADPAVLARLDELNDRYEARFGFPFVEWVNGRSRPEMVAAIEARLGRRAPEELAAGCAALVSIARDRLGRLDPTS